MRRHDAARALAVGFAIALLALGRTPSAQGPARIQPVCIQDVGLPTLDSPDNRATLVLRDGRIAQVLAADAAAPPGVQIVDGSGLVALPAFLDAFTQKGVETPTPVKDQDLPLSEESDVRVDMRLANRKGIQPAFRAADALGLTPETTQAWREAGFGAVLVAPSGELLAGTSTLATTRAAAPRDLVLGAEVFAHAAFRASGGGYPSTLMGYIAQLRQFFLDARWHAELERRHREGRPGARPPFDPDLVAALPLLRAERVLACEAESARDIERWIALADQFGLQIAVVGGNDAARVADTLAARDIQVVLTLDWGKEVDDPLAQEKDDEDEASPAEDPGDAAAAPEAAEAVAPREPDATLAAAAPAQEQPAEIAGAETAGAEAAAEDEPDWTYEEPLPVRVEKRRLWEERRDVGLRLAEKGVRFAFGSGGETPKKLLDKVRTLVATGLPRDVAQAALTSEAARMLGVERRLGRIAPGYDASLALWTADPLTEKDAQTAWIFIDGVGTEFEVKQPDPAAEGEARDAAGTWILTTEMMGESRESTLVLVQDDDGGLSGTLTYESMEGGEQSTPVEGRVRGAVLEVSGSLSFGESSGEVTIEGTLDGDALDATATYRFPFSEEPFEAPVSARRVPEVLLELERHAASCHEDHAHGEVIR